MGLTLIGLGLVLLFAVVGFFRGVWRMLLVFLSLFLCLYLAVPLAPPIGKLISGLSWIPSALRPFLGLILAGLLVFFIFSLIGGLLIHWREKSRKSRGLSARARWERYLGAFLGGIWGFALVVLISMGIQIVGGVEQTVEKLSHTSRQGGMITNTAERDAAVNAGIFSRLKEQIDLTPFGFVAQKVNPVDEKVQQTFSDLMIVLGDPELFAKFREHPVIARFARNPKIMAVAADQVIQAKIQAGRYADLLDDPKITDLVYDREIYTELKEVDFGRILREIINENR